ncbi:transcriptional repressor CTCFL-like isoform X2 [Leptidea sinapis]|uniref:transcriptional repressor CTCFL-like isoform X2 n=1 Tax=Leptidea sinapis TaxID=189913 RepID=UPI0021C41731|nr:transcriptional repressor CTCFL-like isoform X2 [Leptidea sinapis]
MPPPTNEYVLKGGGTDDDTEGAITYFVDQEGRYYYQPTAETVNYVSIENAPVINEIQHESQVLIEAENYQTVTFVPAATENVESTYIFIVQDKEKPDVNENIKEDNYEVDQFEDEDMVDQDEQLELSPESPSQIPKKPNKNRFFKCKNCEYTSHRRYLLMRHMRCHSTERPHQCSICEKGFKTQMTLQNHVNMHKGLKPHVCNDCKAAFTTSGELARHIRYRHTHEKPHQCPYCEYASVEKSKLMRHIRGHTGEKPFRCVHCSYAAPDRFKLTRHMRIHAGEQPFRCEVCNLGFKQCHSLRTHSLIHKVDDKPMLQCPHCPAKCGRKTDLRIHIENLHTAKEPVVCKRCGKSFPDKYSAKIHSKTKTTVAPPPKLVSQPGL